MSVSDEERSELYEDGWQQGGLGILGSFPDLLFDRAGNETLAEFVRGKIREMVKDPAVAELLAPKDHPFFTKRPPLENGYYESFNRDNVTLLDARGDLLDGHGPRVVSTRSTRSSTPPASTR